MFSLLCGKKGRNETKLKKKEKQNTNTRNEMSLLISST